ncbi:MAG TPA: YceD family protein, partial [Acidimicrobiales bacterium]|nr:YceD family protein [Acidimicrobiales bacterium]
TAAWEGECRRCGGTVAGRATSAVRERIVPEDSAEEDEDAYRMTADELDLEPLVRDAVLLELPLAPLCSGTCLGLCPRCGTNWNESPCDCRPLADPRWAALDQLRDPSG